MTRARWGCSTASGKRRTVLRLVQPFGEFVAGALERHTYVPVLHPIAQPRGLEAILLDTGADGRSGDVPHVQVDAGPRRAPDHHTAQCRVLDPESGKGDAAAPMRDHVEAPQSSVPGPLPVTCVEKLNRAEQSDDGLGCRPCGFAAD